MCKHCDEMEITQEKLEDAGSVMQALMYKAHQSGGIPINPLPVANEDGDIVGMALFLVARPGEDLNKQYELCDKAVDLALSKMATPVAALNA